jgi:hypothetical protein
MALARLRSDSRSLPFGSSITDEYFRWQDSSLFCRKCGPDIGRFGLAPWDSTVLNSELNINWPAPAMSNACRV